MSLFKAGVLGAVLLVLVTYLAYTKFANPFATKYTVQATFQSANGLRPDSLVRVAGVNVGRVSSIQPVTNCKQAGSTAAGCQAARVTMEIDDLGLPWHKDATFAIRPRIFLEGNFFVDVHPGTPEAPVAPTGYTFPIQQGTEPVQLDQILTALPLDTRRNLQVVLDQAGQGFKQGGPSFNRSIQYWLPAYEYSAIVGHDALGIQPHDLSNWISQMGTVAAAINAHPQNLKNLITDFNTTANAFARQNVALQQAVGELPRTLATGIPAFNALNASFPPLRQLARALVPGVVSSGPAIDASLPFITQLRYLVQPSELRGLTADLAVTVPDLARLTRATIPLMRNQVRPASSCVSNVIYPWTQSTLIDPHFNASNGFPPHKVYVEGVDFLPGLGGESRPFDANGPIVRVGFTAGSLTYSLTPKFLGQSVLPLGGAQPAPPANFALPPFREDVPCETQPATTDLRAREIAIPAVAGNSGGIVNLSTLLNSLNLPNIVGSLISRDRAAQRARLRAQRSAPTKPTTTSSTTSTSGSTSAAPGGSATAAPTPSGGSNQSSSLGSGASNTSNSTGSSTP